MDKPADLAEALDAYGRASDGRFNPTLLQQTIDAHPQHAAALRLYAAVQVMSAPATPKDEVAAEAAREDKLAEALADRLDDMADYEPALTTVRDLRGAAALLREQAAEIERLRDCLQELAGALWRLEEKGFIGTYDDEAQDECDHLRSIARQAVDRARQLSALPQATPNPGPDDGNPYWPKDTTR